MTAAAALYTQRYSLRPLPPGLTLATIIFGFFRNFLMFHVLVRAAQTLHNRMFRAILCTPVRFFDINPIGEATDPPPPRV